jgi:hypothetical protein
VLNERICVGCGVGEDAAHLETCSVCTRNFCPDCAQKAGFGRKFCSTDCVRSYYFTGDPDDDEDREPD